MEKVEEVEVRELLDLLFPSDSVVDDCDLNADFEDWIDRFYKEYENPDKSDFDYMVRCFLRGESFPKQCGKM